jgi:Predicted transcriptional regulator, consists of a Zn-ribbon and ATP-cone domains
MAIMDCPFCGSESTKVLDTRICRGDRVRKRQCGSCRRRFSTAERITVEYMRVRKRDGRVEPFSRAKLRRSLLRAATGIDISTSEIDTVVNRVLEILQPDAPDVPVPSRQIGELVIEQMHGRDQRLDVVRFRYASLFLGGDLGGAGRHGIDDLIKWLEQEYGPPRANRPRDAVPRIVVKRDGRTEPFAVEKIVASVAAAARGRIGTNRVARTVSLSAVHELRGQDIVTSQQIAAEVLRRLRTVDAVAYLRYAAAAKGTYGNYMVVIPL